MAFVRAANAILYSVLGVPRTLAILERVFGLTHPHPADGRALLPPLDTIRVTYVEHPIGIALHYLFMPLALLVGAVQFSARLRQARPALHRVAGRVFFAALLVGVAGAVIKIVRGDLYGGTLSRLQFSGMAATTLVCATMGAVAARRRRLVAHERWMWRTYLVVWSSSVVSRLGILLLVPLAWRWMGTRSEDYVIPYNAVLAASWAVPLFVADLVLADRQR